MNLYVTVATGLICLQLVHWKRTLEKETLKKENNFYRKGKKSQFHSGSCVEFQQHILVTCMLLITCSNPQVSGFSGMSLVVFTPGGPLYPIQAFSYKYRHIAT